MGIDVAANPTMQQMTAYLDQLARRQTIVATNIANIDTPGYKAKDLEFSQILDAALDGDLARTDPKHLPAGGAASGGRIREQEGLPVRLDQNNVSLDREAAKLAEIALRFSATAQMFSLRAKTIRSAILEGR